MRRAGSRHSIQIEIDIGIEIDSRGSDGRYFFTPWNMDKSQMSGFYHGRSCFAFTQANKGKEGVAT